MSEAPVCIKRFKLNDGRDMPAVGLGTWQGQPGSSDTKTLETSIVHALQSGYRLIDTAQAYGVEASVGRAVRASNIPRSEISIVTKFWGPLLDDPAAALEASLNAMELEYIDVLLMHWPCTASPDWGFRRPGEGGTFVDTWKKMEKLIGPKCRSIGVSNFTQKTIDELLSQVDIVPAVNQIELHALNPNSKLVPYCQGKGIHVMSYSPLGGQRPDGTQSESLTHDLFKSIAKDRNCSTAVLSLSWIVQRGVTVIPKSNSDKRIEENIRLITLTEKEMEILNGASEKIGKLRISDFVPIFRGELDGKPTLMNWTNVDFGWEDEEGNWLT